MEIPGLGVVEKDHFGCYHGPPMAIPVLGGKLCRIVVEGYDGDEAPADFHAAIASFLSIGEDVLKQAAPFVFRYYEDCAAEGIAPVAIASPADVWRHVQFGSEVYATRGERAIYLSLECNCDWEEEHGLQIVFKNGLVVNKVGPFDGHTTNSHAFAEDAFEDVVYVDHGMVERFIAERGLNPKG
jgi:hypothetical protein